MIIHIISLYREKTKTWALKAGKGVLAIKTPFSMIKKGLLVTNKPLLKTKKGLSEIKKGLLIIKTPFLIKNDVVTGSGYEMPVLPTEVSRRK